MIQKFDYNVNGEMVVKDETIKGIAIDFGSVVTAGTKAALADYNEVSLDIFVRRNGGDPVFICQGYLDDILTALYAQTPAYALAKATYGLTNKVKIDFLGGVIALQGGDTFHVRMRANAAGWTSLDTAQANTFINVETIPAAGGSTVIPVVKSFGLNTGDTNVNKNLGNNVIKVVAALDYTAGYWASNKAKFDGVEITGNGYRKNVSQATLENENINYFNDSDETINQMVLFWEEAPINGVNLRGKLDKAADADAKLLSVSLSRV